MTAADTIRETIKHLTAERSELMSQVEQLSSEVRAIDTALKALRSLPGVMAQMSSIPSAPQKRSSGIKAAVIEILKENRGIPIHADAVLSAVRARGIQLSAVDPKATIVTALIRMAQARENKGEAEGVYKLPRNTWVWEERYKGIPSPASEAFIRDFGRLGPSTIAREPSLLESVH
jgi:hypothetical protein